MQFGTIGLGRMGANMVRRLMRSGHECVVFDLNPENGKRLASASHDQTVKVWEASPWP